MSKGTLYVELNTVHTQANRLNLSLCRLDKENGVRRAILGDIEKNCTPDPHPFGTDRASRTLARALIQMNRSGVRQLSVVSYETRRFIGIITMSDIVAAQADALAPSDITEIPNP